MISLVPVNINNRKLRYKDLMNFIFICIYFNDKHSKRRLSVNAI